MSNDKKQYRILFASRLVEEKGIKILIRAIGKSLEEWGNINVSVIWDICSDGPYSSEIQRLAELAPDRVRYYGKVDRETLSSLYRSSDFLFMPSLFLETFGLTALESLSVGTPVIGFKKGGLEDFIHPLLSLDPLRPVDSLYEILEWYTRDHREQVTVDVARFAYTVWRSRLGQIFHPGEKICLIHDYIERIGGAEYYLESLTVSLESISCQVSRYSYRGHASVWKRRIFFVTSLFAFWRRREILDLLERSEPSTIWMHSILRYVGPWGISAVRDYIGRHPETRVYLSHHDVGLMTPFPQSIYTEDDIPRDRSVFAFVPMRLSFFHIMISIVKWFYIRVIHFLLPQKMEHIIFAPFLEKHVRAHFPENPIILLPHTIFPPEKS